MSTKRHVPDSQILKESQSAPWMFAMLLDKYQEPFLRKASYMIGSREEAEDVVQDVFLKIYKNAPKFSTRKGASFNSWAYKILTNTCLSYLAKRKMEECRTRHFSLEGMDEICSGNLDRNAEQVSLAQSILARLPVNLSRLLSLRFLEGRNYKEIAILEHLTLPAVKSGLHRAKKQFKHIATNLV